MKERLVRIKRHWKRPYVQITLVEDQKPDEQIARVAYDEEKIYIDTPVPDFRERLVEIASSIIVDKHLDRLKALRYSFKRATIEDLVKRIVDDVMKESFNRMTSEVKELSRFVAEKK